MMNLAGGLFAGITETKFSKEDAKGTKVKTRGGFQTRPYLPDIRALRGFSNFS